MTEIIQIDGIAFVVGMTWRESTAKLVKAQAKEDASALTDEYEGSVGCYALAESPDKSSVSYGVAGIESAAVKGLKRSQALYSLAGSVAAKGESGIYVRALKSRKSQGTAYWVVGVSGGVVIPQTDCVYGSMEELQGNVAMLRAVAPGLTIFMDASIDDVLFHDQHSFAWSESISPPKDRAVVLPGMRLGGMFSSISAAAVGSGAALLIGLGYLGWINFFSQTQPSPEDVAALSQQQQEQAHEARLQAFAIRFHPEHVNSRWAHSVRALQAVRLAGSASGFRPNEFACGFDGCRASFEPVPYFSQVPDVIVSRMAEIGTDVAMQREQDGGMTINWQMPTDQSSAARANAPPAELSQWVSEWIASQPERTVFDQRVNSMQRPLMQVLNTSFVLRQSADAQPEIRILDQVEPFSTRSGAGALLVFARVDASTLESWPTAASGTLPGVPSGLIVSFYPSGLISKTEVQVLVVLRK